MASEREDSADEARWYRLFTWFDIEIAAVVTILLGLFQLLLSASLIQTDKFLPKFFFLLPFVLGMVMVIGKLQTGLDLCWLEQGDIGCTATF
ncbi:hypothetical protein CHARACLAT_025160 [Characodon lateralis]|uniref:Uncharacterized protein n=1 Tax=Characodon lateralis TaxID=208331 RepID=A0ABU7E3C7_9TELE|nr:hypothetical protein [Characodon lateralis]